MKKNDLLTLTADGLGADLEGVCRADGMAVFVPGMLPGETARVRIVKVQSRFAFGRMEGKPLTASPARKTPDCAAYPRCGGCTGRHMTYETTLEAKRQQVQDCFRRIGHIDIDVPPVLGMADPSHYRNKTALPVGGTVEEPAAGFFAPRSHDIIPIAQCPNAMPPADEICRRVLGWMRRFHVEPYVEETHTGLVRHIVVRVNRKGEAMAVLVYEWRSLSAEGQASILGLRDIYEQMWLDVLGEARLAGYCQGDPFILRRFLTGALSWTTTWFRPEGPMSLD